MAPRKRKVEVEVDETEDEEPEALEELEEFELDDLESLADDSDDEEEDEEEDEEDEAPRRKKKPAASKSKTSKAKKGSIGTQELAEALGTDGKNLRVMLRARGIEKADTGRYEWKDVDAALEEMGFDDLEEAVDALRESRNERLEKLKDDQAKKRSAAGKTKAKRKPAPVEDDDEDEDEDDEEEAPPKRTSKPKPGSRRK